MSECLAPPPITNHHSPSFIPFKIIKKQICGGNSLTKILDCGGMRLTVHMTKTMNSNSPHTHLSFFLWDHLWEETMVGFEKWRGRLCYASSMACHSAYYSFSQSPQRDFINKTKFLKPSSRSKPVLISSIANARASYNTLVSEVLLFLYLYVNLKCSTIYTGIVMYRVITMFEEDNILWLF